MKRPEKNDPSRLRDALAAWDPVRREGEPAADELAAVRRRVLAAERAERRAPAGGSAWRPALATMAAAALLVVLALVRDGGAPAPGIERQAAGGGTAGAPAAGAPGGGAERRPGGDTQPAGAAGGGAETGADGETARLSGPSGGGAVASRGAEQVPPEGARPVGGRAASPASPSTAAAPSPPPAALAARAAPASASSRAAAPPSAIADTAGAGPAVGLPPADPPGEGSGTASTPGDAALATRQVQLIAPGGTRIVWLVAADPNPTTAPNREDT